MAAPRKPDVQLQRAMEEARQLRAARNAVLDQQVRRAHASGATAQEIARKLGKSDSFVRDTLKRLNLTPNGDALFLRQD